MNYEKLVHEIRRKKSFLCVGLDTDINKIPIELASSPHGIVEFNKEIIKATSEYAVAFKLNTAFYEARGWQGWKELYETVKHIPKNCFIIADAKRADIGNTAEQYASAFFKWLNADAVTLSPYMGLDTIQPFLEYPDKISIILALTSNPGSADFEMCDMGGMKLYEMVIRKVTQLAGPEKLMFVVGATKADLLMEIRKIIPQHFLLVPGVGAQGGSLEEVVKYGLNDDIGLLVNSSRQIIYASKNRKEFADAAAESAKQIARQMKNYF